MAERSASRRAPEVLSVLVLLAVTACQPSAPMAAGTSTTTQTARATSRGTDAPRTDLTPGIPAESLKGVGIQIWHPWFGPEASLLESQVAEFNQKNEWGITVRALGHTSFTELYDSVTLALPGTDGPQLVIALPEHLISWDTAGYVVDLNHFVADPGAGLSQDDVGDFPPIFWNQDEIDGRRLGVPAQRSAFYLIYNQSWARRLGFARAPRSPEDFRKQACAAHAAMAGDDDPGNDARGGWLIRADSMTFLSWLVAFGGGVQDGDGYRFLSPRNLEATVYLKQLYDENCGWLPQNDDEEAAAFAGGQALFTTAGLEELSGFGRAMAEANNPDDWTVLSFPGAAQTGLLTYGSSYTVLKSTSEQELASWLFIRWLLSAENQKKWIEVTGLLPLRSSISGGLGDYSKSHPQWAAAVDLLSEARIEPQLASWRQVRVMIGDGFAAMFRANTPAGRVAEILAIMDRTASDLSK